MAKRKIWVLGALLLAVTGTVTASNMGFKFVPNVTGAIGPVKTFTISLPLNNNYLDANSIGNDINTSCATTSKVIRVNPSAGGSSTNFWIAPGGPGVNFLTVKGVGYEFEVASASCTGWVVVGSHDPAFVYGPSTSWFQLANTSYLTSVPYHTTATLANDLITSIPLGSKLTRVNPSPGGSSTNFWVPPTGPGINFPVVIGAAYLVEVSGPTTWTPAHY